MTLWRHEWLLLTRQRLAVVSLLLLAVLSIAAVIAGLAEVHRQHQVIDRIQPQQQADEAAIARWVSVEGDAGNAAYYTAHATWDSPSAMAFAALGQRDVAPYVLRVRALGLEGQLHESESYNAELALPGRFDWAFVLTYLMPIFLIGLLHDSRSSEREAGRAQMLTVMARSPRWLWGRRVILRVGLAWLAVALPLAIGAIAAEAAPAQVAPFLLISLVYALIWTLLILLIARATRASVANAAMLSALWLVITLIVPTLALLAINDRHPVRQGVELTLAQREEVHAGWDRPREETMAVFVRLYPEWADRAEVESGFHWKWYYAFQHLGDHAVAPQVAAYRRALLARDADTRLAGWVLPAVGVQYALHRLAQTDLRAQLAYQDDIRGFHEQLRRYYYPYVFNERPFREADFANAPRWTGRPDD
jgi:ABC-2 type transport system permease protein